jgi:hypothetical protein
MPQVSSRGERSLWSRWRAVARKAAAVQSTVVLWVLYYVLFLPIALIQHPFTDPLGAREADPPRWRDRPEGPQDTRAARLQF